MKVLVVVDMQKDFIDGALGTSEAVSIVENVKKKIEDYRKKGYGVVFTRDTHGADYLNTQEGRNLAVEHCIENTSGWEISKELDTKDSTIINKPSFGSLELPAHIKKAYENLEEIEVIGLCTDICVISNAMILKAAFPETLVSVDASCCAGVTRESHRNSLEAMKMCQIRILNDN